MKYETDEGSYLGLRTGELKSRVNILVDLSVLYGFERTQKTKPNSPSFSHSDLIRERVRSKPYKTDNSTSTVCKLFSRENLRNIYENP